MISQEATHQQQQNFYAVFILAMVTISCVKELGNCIYIQKLDIESESTYYCF